MLAPCTGGLAEVGKCKTEDVGDKPAKDGGIDLCDLRIACGNGNLGMYDKIAAEVPSGSGRDDPLHLAGPRVHQHRIRAELGHRV